MTIKFLPFLLLFFCLTHVCFSQNKQETEEWVLSKLNSYSNSGMSAGGNSFQKTLKFSIKDGKLIGRDHRLSYSIDLKSITDYSYELLEGFKDDTFGTIPSIVNIKLQCKEGDCVKLYSLNNEFKRGFSNISISMDDSFRNENLPERMKKAFKNLVQFNGGQFVTEKY
jgi:hypothetical protein